MLLSKKEHLRSEWLSLLILKLWPFNLPQSVCQQNTDFEQWSWITIRDRTKIVDETILRVWIGKLNEFMDILSGDCQCVKSTYLLVFGPDVFKVFWRWSFRTHKWVLQQVEKANAKTRTCREIKMNKNKYVRYTALYSTSSARICVPIRDFRSVTSSEEGKKQVCHLSKGTPLWTPHLWTPTYGSEMIIVQIL